MTTSKTTAEIQKTSDKSQKTNMSKNLNAELDLLCREREAWEKGAYKTSNDQLYHILGRCLDIYQQLRADLQQRKVFKEKLDTLKAKNVIDFKESTNLPTRIVRYVFRNSGKRSLAYAKVLIAATEAGIDSLALAAWISKEEGIEQIRRKDKNGIKPSVVSANLQQTAADYYAGSKGLVTAFKPPKSLLPNAEGTDNFALALVRKEDDGQVTIVYGTNKSTLVKQMLILAGKQLAETKGKAAVSKKRREQKAALLAVVKAA